MTIRMCHAATIACGTVALAALWLAPAGADDSAKDNIARIRAGDRLYLEVSDTLPGRPIKGVYQVEPSGKLPLGPGQGRVQVNGLTPEEAEVKVRDHLAKTIKDPAVLLTWHDPVAHETRGPQPPKGAPFAAPPPAGSSRYRMLTWGLKDAPYLVLLDTHTGQAWGMLLSKGEWEDLKSPPSEPGARR
jgi:hypothetical protein